tara:strand:+ start:446 stop:817 length:372 start_codon:yes stop_codon:yes gene_type:complete
LALVRFFDLWTLVAASCVFYTVSGKKKIQRAHNRRSLLFSSSAREVPFGHATEDETRFRADDLGFLLGLLLGLLLEVAFKVRRGARRTHTKAIYFFVVQVVFLLSEKKLSVPEYILTFLSQYE